MVSHLSTNQAQPCLASEIRYDWERSGWRGHRCTKYLKAESLAFLQVETEGQRGKASRLRPHSKLAAESDKLGLVVVAACPSASGGTDVSVPLAW